MGIADDWICWRTRRKVFLARSEAKEFEDDIDGTDDGDEPEIGDVFSCHGHGFSKSSVKTSRRTGCWWCRVDGLLRGRILIEM